MKIMKEKSFEIQSCDHGILQVWGPSHSDLRDGTMLDCLLMSRSNVISTQCGKREVTAIRLHSLRDLEGSRHPTDARQLDQTSCYTAHTVIVVIHCGPKVGKQLFAAFPQT